MSIQAEILSERADLTSMSLYTVVKVKESTDSFWKEVADVVSVSSSGAGFYVQRECKIGRLISLMLPLPPHLRSYDHDKELYKVWGVIQHCHMRSADAVTGYHIGVAFIGKHPPESYREDPTQSYRICGMSSEGLWKIKEADSPFKTRRNVRYWKSIELYLATVDSQRMSLDGERSVTENISKNGAAVISTLDVSVGDRVKFISEEFDFSGLAVVCNRQIGDDKRPRLHLEFVENLFPIDAITLLEAEIVAE